MASDKDTSASKVTHGFQRDIVVAGELMLKRVLMQNEAVYPFSLQGKQDVHQFSYVSGATNIEFLLKACAEYDYLQTQKFRNKGTNREFAKDIKNYRTKGVLDSTLSSPISSTIYGPSSIGTTERKRKALLGALITETVAYGTTHSLIKQQDSNFKSFRRTEYLGNGKRRKCDETPVKQQVSSKDDLVLTLSLDFEHFLENPLDTYFEQPLQFRKGFLVARLLVKPGELTETSQLARQTVIADNLNSCLQSHANVPRIAIISAESLRACHEEISYRVTWERTISDTLSVVDRIREKGTGMPALKSLKNFDWLVVVFANDAALIIPPKGVLTGIDGDTTTQIGEAVIFIASSSGIEHDYRNGFTGRTRGTETLVTTAISMYLARLRSSDINNPQKIASHLRLATTLGIKASRHLQAHGYVSVKAPMRRYVTEKEVTGDEQLTEILRKLEKNWGPRWKDGSHDPNSISASDSTFFLWNRLQSAQYVDHFQRKFFETPIGLPGDDIITWPFGDIAEILYDGYPTYGSFPPTSFALKDGRDIVYKQTTNVANAWHRAGWLSSSVIPRDRAKRGSESGSDSEAITPDGRSEQRLPNPGEPFCDRSSTNEHDSQWWSLREVALQNFVSRVFKDITADHREGPDGSKSLIEKVQQAFLECLVVYGTDHLNATNQIRSKLLDLRLVFHCQRLLKLNLVGRSIVIRNLATYYGNAPTDKRVSDLAGFLGELNEKPFYGAPEFIPTTETLVPRNLIDLVPELKVGKWHSIDRRDIQSVRDIRERLINYQKSHINKPLNLGVFGAPGNGKSFVVKEVLTEVYKGIKDVEFLEYNLAQFTQPSDLTDSFLEIQNVSLNGRLPVAFWDEYDTDLNNIPLGWLSYFLGPMQDGKFFVDRGLKTLPECIFVFAGSMFSNFGSMIALDRLARGKPLLLAHDFHLMGTEVTVGKFNCHQWRRAKGSDFKSRLTGVLDISGITEDLPLKLAWEKDHVPQLIDEITSSQIELDLPELMLKVELPSDEDSRIVRRALALRSICDRNAKWLFDQEGRLAISDGVLKAFLDPEMDLEHGMRSLESLVLMSSLQGRAKVDKSVVPTSSQVRIHADPDRFRRTQWIDQSD